jgi:hypothetical protein
MNDQTKLAMSNRRPVKSRTLKKKGRRNNKNQQNKITNESSYY